MITEQQCVQDVKDVNNFLAMWFGGHIENTDQDSVQLYNIFSTDFVYVDPEGGLHDRNALYDFVKSLHGTLSPELRHVLENFHCKVIADDLLLMTVEEIQRESGSTLTQRLCSIVFRSNPARPNQVEWVHLHESMMEPTEQ